MLAPIRPRPIMPSCMDTLLAVTLVPTEPPHHASGSDRRRPRCARGEARVARHAGSAARAERARVVRDRAARRLGGAGVLSAPGPAAPGLVAHLVLLGRRACRTRDGSGVELRRGTRALARARASARREHPPDASRLPRPRPMRQRTTRTTWCACWARHRGSTWRSWAWDRTATSARCSRATRCCARSGDGSLPSRMPRSRRPGA